MKTAPQYVHSNVDAWPIFSLLGPKLGARPPPEWTSQKGLGGSEVGAEIIFSRPRRGFCAEGPSNPSFRIRRFSSPGDLNDCECTNTLAQRRFLLASKSARMAFSALQAF